MMPRNIKISFLVYLLLLLHPAWSHAAESRWPLGMAVGAGLGAVGGAAIGYGVATLCEENKSDCRQQLPFLGGGVGLIIGGSIGGVIGSFFENESISFLPRLFITDDGKVQAGLAFSGSF